MSSSAQSEIEAVIEHITGVEKTLLITEEAIIAALPEDQRNAALEPLKKFAKEPLPQRARHADYVANNCAHLLGRFQ